MCGIGGWIGSGERREAEHLMNALHHRGPDGSGMWMDPYGRAGLIHTRLAIIDPSEAGAQPMVWQSTENENTAILVFNGEIYNYRELRTELETQGEVFSGHSDTEVLLRLLVREGKAGLPKLAGMFAFAFFDTRSGYGLLARDPFGIKPLYYSNQDNRLLFASEWKALQPLLENAQTDPDGIRDTLLWGSVPEPTTLYRDIRQLPAGCLLEWDGKNLERERWHHLRFGGDSPADPVATTRNALLESMQRHLVSDVPVGIFLSGGIDSTAVLALAREVLGPHADLRTFSIGFDNPAYDESSIARRTADYFGAHHTEWRITQEEGQVEIANYLAAMDQPTIDGFNTWCVSALARRAGIKVVLSGLGGDEVFAGYRNFKQIPRLLRLYRLTGPGHKIFQAMARISPPASRWGRVAAFLGGSGEPLAAFQTVRCFFNDAEARKLTIKLCGEDPGAAKWDIEELPENPRDTVSLLELTRYMRNQLLRDSDVFSMAHGLELRVPLVDARLFEQLAPIPAETRLQQGKQLLLDAVPEIPEWVRNQPKRGFSFPFREWIQGGFGEILSVADQKSNIPLVNWYRGWTLAALLMKMEKLDENG